MRARHTLTAAAHGLSIRPMSSPSPQIAWSFDPGALIVVAALGVLYLTAWRRARKPGEPHPPGSGRLALFAAGS